ncbi:hypothetical protein JX266_008264 [Neoarthrinium moseri]|nr:hypothetical protein JX266_008264 [Neoarthrinium moseri]
MTMAKTEVDGWRAKVKKLREDLEAAGFKETLQLDDFDHFQGALHSLLHEYSQHGIAKLVAEHVEPHFDHIKSFERAIASAVQQLDSASYVWSASLAVMECTCRHVSYMKDTFEQLEKFYETFPKLDAYMKLFQDDYKLRYLLQRLYDIYSEFCLCTIRYMRKRTLVDQPANIATNLIHSKHRRKLSTILQNWTEAKAQFEEHIRYVLAAKIVTPKTFPAVPDRNIVTEMSAQGVRGMGKTQAALAYSRTYEDHYFYRFWIRADDPARLAESFTSIYNLLRIDEPRLLHSEAVKEKLETTDKTWLLVFDNIEEGTIEAVITLLPTRSMKQSAIIFTSQFEQHKHKIDADASLPLKSLDTEQSIELLRKCLGRETDNVDDEDQKVLEEVSDMLGGLPLAIAHIGAYISESKRNISYFRDFFEANWQKSAWSSPSLTETNERILDIVWQLALNELPPNARQLIDVMAYLNPDVIPEDWLEADIEEDPNWWSSEGSAKIELLYMGRSLSRRCLVDIEDNVYSIHRSLQLALRMALDHNPLTREMIFRHALRIVARASPGTNPLQIPNPKNWRQFEQSNPHALTMCQAFLQSDPPIEPSLQLAETLYYAGFHTWERWNYVTRDGTALLETAEKILDRLEYDIDGKLRADISCILSLLLDAVGLSNRTEAFERLRRVREIRKIQLKRSQRLGLCDNSEHLYYNSVNDFALSKLQHDDFHEAEKLFSECFDQYKRWGTEEEQPFEYAKYYHNMALVRMYQERYEEAIDLSKRGIEIKARHNGKDNSRYWWCQYDIACIMTQAGQLDAGLELHLEVLKNRQRICGALHGLTVQSIYSVGAMYHHLGQLEKAEEYLRDCVQKGRKIRWHDEALGRAKYHLSLLIRERTGQSEEASTLEREAVKMLENICSTYGQCPVYLTDTPDILTIFDWAQSCSEGRWTGRGLLRIVQAHYKVSSPAKIEIEETSRRLAPR